MYLNWLLTSIIRVHSYLDFHAWLFYRKVSQIQNAGLGEFKIRDLNDEINKLLREKRHWENRIIELGGRDMRRRSRMLDREGKEIPGR